MSNYAYTGLTGNPTHLSTNHTHLGLKECCSTEVPPPSHSEVQVGTSRPSHIVELFPVADQLLLQQAISGRKKLALSHTHTHTHSLFPSLSHTHTHSLSPSLSHTHTLSLPSSHIHIGLGDPTSSHRLAHTQAGAYNSNWFSNVDVACTRVCK